MESRKCHFLRVVLGCVLVPLWVSGCGKGKQEEFPASPPSATPVAPTASAPAAAARPNQPTAVENQKTFAEAEAAMKAKDYQKAVEAALVLQQQKQLSEAQAQAARNQMVRLQQQLAGAVLSGDPNAKAAADRLRQAAAHH